MLDIMLFLAVATLLELLLAMAVGRFLRADGRALERSMRLAQVTARPPSRRAHRPAHLPVYPHPSLRGRW